MNTPMTTIVRVHRKGQMTLPSAMRTAIGIADGDLIEATVLRGKIVLTPKSVIDRSGFPNADDEYTPEQRRVIDAQLAEGLADVKAGRVFGPFETHAEFLKALHKEAGKAERKKAKRPAL